MPRRTPRRRVLAAALLGSLLAASGAGAQEEGAGAQAAEILHSLRFGFWNERIHAVHQLGPLGEAGLPDLEFAARDADWQVRMTAVHFMGRLGRPGLEPLAAVLKEEPCRHVRITAVHWLGSMGPEASDALRQALADESGVLRLNDRYWLRKLGAETRRDDERADAGDMTAARREDLKRCLASNPPGRARWAQADARPKVAAPPDEEEAAASATPAPIDGAAAALRLAEQGPPPLPVASPRLDPSAPQTAAEAGGREREARTLELDRLLALGEPESFPEQPVRAARPPQEAVPPSPEPAGRQPAPASAVNASRGPGEAFPDAGPGLGVEEPERAGPALMKDAGRGKSPGDPLPGLLKLLKEGDARQKARAADELGKLGPRAASAVGPLSAALGDSGRRVRASAALALGNIGRDADRAVPALVRALKDKDEDVSESAAVALGRLGTPAARKAFRKHLREQAGTMFEEAR